MWVPDTHFRKSAFSLNCSQDMRNWSNSFGTAWAVTWEAAVCRQRKVTLVDPTLFQALCQKKTEPRGLWSQNQGCTGSEPQSGFQTHTQQLMANLVLKNEGLWLWFRTSLSLLQGFFLWRNDIFSIQFSFTSSKKKIGPFVLYFRGDVSSWMEADLFCKICPRCASISLSLKRMLQVSCKEKKGTSILKNLRRKGNFSEVRKEKEDGGF